MNLCATCGMVNCICAESKTFQPGAVIDIIEIKVREERERCARVAESMVIPGHSVQAPSCLEIARKIREG